MKTTLAILAAAAATGAVIPCFADDDGYAVTEATATATAALYTSAASVPTYSFAEGALSDPFLITYRDGETVSVTSPNGVTTTLSGTDGTIEFTPASGGLWTFTNSNGSTAYVGVGWAADLSDGFAAATDSASLAWFETTVDGPDRKVKSRDVPSIAYSDATFANEATGTVTLTLTSPSGGETTYTKEPDVNALTHKLEEAGVWTVVLTTVSGTSTAYITVMQTGTMLIIR